MASSYSAYYNLIIKGSDVSSGASPALHRQAGELSILRVISEILISCFLFLSRSFVSIFKAFPLVRSSNAYSVVLIFSSFVLYVFSEVPHLSIFNVLR